MVHAKVMLLGRSCRRGGSVCHVGRCVCSDTLVLGAAGHITGDMPNGVRAAVSGVQSRVPWMAGSASRCVTREGPMHSASSSCTRQLRVSPAVCFLLRQWPHACLLSPLQVKRSRSKGGLAGPDGTKSVFGQMCAKMSSFGPDSLLLPHRVWKVKFVGENLLGALEHLCPRQWSPEPTGSTEATWCGSIGGLHTGLCEGTSSGCFFPAGESVDDCGGGYSESIAEICEELQNGLTPLLIVTPNGRDESGANRDCYLLSPAARAPVHSSMFRFLGELLGRLNWVAVPCACS